MKELNFIRNGAEVTRYHTWPTLRQQRLDGHQWGVAMLYSFMATYDGSPETGGLSVPGLMTALTHDLPEQRYGDMPAPAKREMAETLGVPDFHATWNMMEQSLLVENGLCWQDLCNDAERRWLKLADAMDGALFCVRERELGNKMMGPVFQNFRSYIQEITSLPDKLAVGDPEKMEWQIIWYIDDMWEQANGGR